MRVQFSHNEITEIRSDGLASVMLVIGIFITGQGILYGLISIITYLVAGWLLPYSLPVICLGGIVMIYGLIRTKRGSSETKSSVKTALVKSGCGSLAGGVLAVIVFALGQEILGGGHWSFQFFIITIPIPLFFGLSAGGLCGLIAGRKWKNNQAAFAAGAVPGFIISFLYIMGFILSLSGVL